VVLHAPCSCLGSQQLLKFVDALRRENKDLKILVLAHDSPKISEESYSKDGFQIFELTTSAKRLDTKKKILNTKLLRELAPFFEDTSSTYKHDLYLRLTSKVHYSNFLVR